MIKDISNEDYAAENLPDLFEEYEQLVLKEPPTSPITKVRYTEDCLKFMPEARLTTAIPVHFREVLRVTKPHSKEAGAILVYLAAPSEILEDIYKQEGNDNSLGTIWLPKKLCSNLTYAPDSDSGTLMVWNKFLKENYSSLYYHLKDLEG